MHRDPPRQTGMQLRSLRLSRAECLLICLIIFVALSLLIPSFETHRRQYHSCALCRLTWNDYQGMFGRRWSEFEETECSEWYRENIEPEHEHVWQRSSSMAGFNMFGTPIWVADSTRAPGIMSLTPVEQIAIYRHVPNVDEARPLFLSIRDDAENGEQLRYRQSRYKAGILREWVRSGFAKSWEEIKQEVLAGENDDEL